MDRFSQILYDLGKEMDLDLYPDPNRICQLNFHDELHIQIHYDEPKEEILIASFLYEVPPGKYREKLFRACLISNNEYPRVGTLSYSEKNNKLTFEKRVFAPNLQSDKLYQILQDFFEKAKTWKDAIERGAPLPVQPSNKSSGGSMFGMKP
ncbi:MAG: CesT family type III secretion system chaperone [Simkaniaceae bacterium]|nr:CesT family type III secretion system chaperone [Candidatus Sacchlamyda saccharinae]